MSRVSKYGQQKSHLSVTSWVQQAFTSCMEKHILTCNSHAVDETQMRAGG